MKILWKHIKFQQQKMKHIINRKRKLFIQAVWIISGITTYSCNNQAGEKVLLEEKYPTGQISMTGYTIDGKKEGVFKFFDESGRLTHETNFKNDLEDGLSINYYPSGNTESKKRFVRGYKLGIQEYYHDKKSINLLAQKEFVKTYYDSSKLNTWFFFQNGTALKDSSRYYKFLNAKSSYKKNEDYELKVKLEAPFYNQFMGLRLVNYHEEYQENISPEDSSVIHCDEFIGSIKIDTKEKGNKIIRFIILDYKLDEDGFYLINNIYGEHKYKVE